ncbi:MAG TPA: hypothetical protein DCK79_08380, partial [Candidatus Atribacteria bacterium]|nr:hypothetical protein [Candidatus Atribacteria bacterium]
NLDYQRYLNYQRPDSFKENENFSYCVHFIRKIYQEPDSTQGYIQIGSKRIILDPSYINLFTLSKWDLEKEIFYIYIQRERQFEPEPPSFYLQLVKKIPFEINKASDKKVVDFYLSYNH